MAACTALLVAPTLASAGLADDVLGGVKNTVDQTVKSVNGLLGGGGAAPTTGPTAGPAPTPAAEGAELDPTIEGTNPHAQGEVLDTTVGTPILDPIDVVVGQSRGEQDENGAYSGKVTVVSALGLDVSVDTDEDNPNETSPLDSLNQGLLQQLCDASTVCLTALDFSSTTTGNSSTNNFSVLNADIGDGAITTGVIESEGNIAETSRCQGADASASAANVGALDLIGIGAISSSSESRACRGEEGTTDSDSEVLNLNGTGLLALLGCDEQVVDDAFGIAGLIDGVCNGDDTNGTQADAPYNVRKAIGLDLLAVLNALGITLEFDGAKSETHVQAPERTGPECPDPNNPDCPPECPDPDNPDCPPEDECPDPDNPDCPPTDGLGPGGPDGPSAEEAPDDDLPFTGADMGTLGAIGLGVMAVGLALMAAADRRRHATRS